MNLIQTVVSIFASLIRPITHKQAAKAVIAFAIDEAKEVFMHSDGDETMMDFLKLHLTKDLLKKLLTENLDHHYLDAIVKALRESGFTVEYPKDRPETGAYAGSGGVFNDPSTQTPTNNPES